MMPPSATRRSIWLRRPTEGRGSTLHGPPRFRGLVARAVRSSRSARLTPAQARRLFAYNERVFHRFVRRVRKLPWRSARRRRETGHQTLFDTLVHILNVHEVWLAYIVRGRTSDPELEALFAERGRHPRDWAGFRTYDRKVWGLVEAYLRHLTPRELAKPVRVFWMPGTYVVSDALLQVTFEQAHHLGEIIGALWQDDVEPPEMTWIRVSQGSAPKRR
jgi:uncharacterized damage-inducible protein DinB